MEPSVEMTDEAAGEVSADNTDAWRALLIPVGRDWHAVDMAVVREVVRGPLLTPLPTAPAPVLGVFNLRGDIVALFHTGVLLGREPVMGHDFAVVIESTRGPFSLAASEMPRAAVLGEPAPADLPGTQPSFALGSQLATLLDPEVVLTSSGGGGPS
jgi:chemotaxis signal transduction protein